jgi:hypothetical protein
MRAKALTAFEASLLFVCPAHLLAEQGDDTRIAAAEFSIPEGTPFKLHLHSTISSKTSRIGDRVLTTLVDPVAVQDTDVLPAGLRIGGNVAEVEPAGHRGKSGCLTIAFDSLELPNGEKVAMLGSLTEVFFIGSDGNANVGSRGLCGSGASRKMQVVIVAAAAAAGASGGAGSGIAGGMVGGLVAYLLPRGKAAALSAGSVLGMRLDRELTVKLAGITRGTSMDGSTRGGQPHCLTSGSGSSRSLGDQFASLARKLAADRAPI